MKETFGEYIRLLRTENGMTLTQLAAQLGMDSANLSKIENNKREFDEKRLEKLALAFNLDTKELRDELFSEKFANKIYSNCCSEKALELAEQKVKYLKQSNVKQKKLNFQS
ncbi:MAG: helix-turn-helix transcriptional regulator [Salinivirgaceae bacterium]|nr:helix-turn-helix transcriptional regulator [Salinivirgaceae bacterium]